MDDKNTDFPQYRKLTNNKSLYKVESERSFIELQKMGKSIFKFEIQARKYPEILRIQDMINCEVPFETSNKTEYEKLNNQLKNQ